MLIKQAGKYCELQDGEEATFILNPIDYLVIGNGFEVVSIHIPEWLATAIREAFEKEISTNMNRGA